MIEIMIAIVILTMGVLAMAGSTGYVTVQTRIADVRTERAAAMQEALEQLRASPFPDVQDRVYQDALTISGYEIWWEMDSLSYALKEVELYSRGLGYRMGTGWVQTMVDTVGTSITRPYP